MGGLELWQSMGVALAIGLLIGAERERDRPGRTAGVRTFALVALIGSVAVQVPTVVAVVLCAGVVLLVVAGYVVSEDEDRGITTETAVIATLGLGALSHTAPAVAVAVAVTTTVLLVSRENLHRFVRETVTDQERSDALVFFVAAFVVLPVLPSGEVGPYGAWVPQRIWLLVVLIIAISWVGYAATRLLGARRGVMIGGLAGGFVSGTATTGVMAARARRREVPVRGALAGALLASVATLVQLAVVTSLVDSRVTVRLLPAIVAGSVVMVAEAWWLGRSVRGEDDAAAAGRPFAIVPALVLAAIISIVLPVALWLQDRYGAAGALAASATAALADVHGASVAMTTLVHTGDLSLATAVAAIGAGLATNTLGKVVVGAAGGGARFAGALLLCLLPAIAVVALALALA
ncbi:MgtC/SapB family protein [Nocardioides sediminis]|uniref:MgtC/SapB family protein n=1 Tax=Nocardioides sediminis TaxID=433648 RepID=UPI000D2F6934|nr:DUF4010 domain-containing protein [Nocardioides sediminis]